MSRRVVSFERRGVLRPPAEAPCRTERFVSVRRVLERVAILLDDATIERDRRVVRRGLSRSAEATLLRLVGELGGPDPSLRLLRAVEWYREHAGDRYVPWIEGARSLYEKFGRLEARMREAGAGDSPGETVDEVVAGLFNGSRVLAESFRSDLLAGAMLLDLGGAREAVVAARLGEMYRAIRAARASPVSEGTPGALTLLGCYVGWLSERDWTTMTTRVLDLDSPAFGQFRREVASRHPRGADPVTGRV